MLAEKKMLIQQAQEQISTGKMHNACAGCTSALYFSFSLWFPCFLHPTGAFEKVRFPKPVDAPQRFYPVHFKHFLSQTTKKIGNSAWKQTQSKLVFLRKFGLCRNTTINRDKNRRQWAIVLRGFFFFHFFWSSLVGHGEQWLKREAVFTRSSRKSWDVIYRSILCSSFNTWCPSDPLLALPLADSPSWLAACISFQKQLCVRCHKLMAIVHLKIFIGHFW